MARRRIEQFSLVVDEYDKAIAFFVSTLGFELIEDTDLGGGKRWVRVAPGSASGAAAGAGVLLAKAATPEQRAAIGNQTGGRVFVFLETDDCQRDVIEWTRRGVKFRGPAREEPYGTVAVFEDLYGNAWDLIQRRS